ncbi:cyclin-domain-containing protein [Auriscalpium vulgare]|uniref:Cyclin-domain-containing protein n=1 Tax=Auriscalpium vulgare TaxID=40419 RepID=A0ACB8RLQ2_9AGAM|nr:cyclin-domain-containing protein [Auriscalpium vulgare]
MESSSKVGLPPAYEDADIDHLCQLMALMFERLMSINDRIPLSPEGISRFHSASVPHIRVLEYLRRIVRFTNVEKTCLLIVMHYIDQICARVPTFVVSSLTVHRFTITAVALASKTLCDAFCTNAHYARIGGITTHELARLEREFLFAIDWRLTCTREVLQLYYENLVAHSGGRFFLLGTQSASSAVSSDSDVEIADFATSRSASPSSTHVPASAEDDDAPVAVAGPPPSAVPEPSNGPTLEQNMAFEQFQRSRGLP